MKIASALIMTLSLMSSVATPAQETPAAKEAALTQTQSSTLKSSMDKLETELVAKYGETQRARLRRGMTQVANFWRSEDGDTAAFEQFVRIQFAGDQATFDTMFSRFQSLLEQRSEERRVGKECRSRWAAYH